MSRFAVESRCECQARLSAILDEKHHVVQGTARQFALSFGNGGTVACTAPLMSANAPNNTATIDITVFIDPATKNNLVNATRVDATVNNFNQPTFSTFTLTTPVGPTSDLVLTKTHTPDPVTAGTDFTYTITGPDGFEWVSADVATVTDLQPGTYIVKVEAAEGYVLTGDVE